MLKLFAFLWTGCWHKWSATGKVTRVFEEPSDKMPVYSLMNYSCSRCGRVKAMKI
jgi:beta-glucanase (GH16 family)